MATENIIREIEGKSTKDTFKLTVSSKPELRTMAESLAAVYNDAVLDGNFNPVIEIIAEDNKETAVAVREAMEFAVNKYTSIARTECFDALKATDNPMLEAVKQLTYPTIRIVDKPGKKDGEAPKTSIEDSEKSIDLLKLHKYVGGDGIGADKNWAYKVEKLNFLMTAQKAVDLGIDPKAVHDSYAMSEISRDINLGKTPTSKTNILKTVQAIVTAMVGEEYKATSHDVNFLMSVYSRKNRKALTVTCANHKYMRQYMAEICHRIVLGKSYALDFKAKRQ
jgi:hypothetical protein